MKNIPNRQKKVVQPRQHKILKPGDLQIHRKKSEKVIGKRKQK